MTLQLENYVDLPANEGSGGFDHADVHAASDRLYVAHTSNNSLDVIDCAQERYIASVSNLSAVAGALVSEARGLVFTSNRGENTVSLFKPGREQDATKVSVGVKPNGLAFDPARGILLVANVGDPSIADSFTISVVDIEQRARIAEFPVPGRTRWAVHDPLRNTFYVNLAKPSMIVRIDGSDPRTVTSEIDIGAVGPHGLDIEPATGRLYCACDDGALLAIDAASGRVLGQTALSGSPDVVFLHSGLGRLYVAIGDPGVIDVIDTRLMRVVQTIDTEAGAHTLAIDRKRGRVYAFLPETHRAAVYFDND